MAQRVFLHVGMMKSGTTYIQRRLFANQERLAEAGYELPADGNGQLIFAVGDVLGRKRMGGTRGGVREGAWQRVVDRSLEWRGDVIISVELLGDAGPRGIRKVLDSFPGCEIHVVITARDLNRTVPARWQEMMQNRGTVSWAEYVDAVRKRSRGPGQAFWRHQDLGQMATRWAEGLGDPSRVHVITVGQPGAPADQLWNRFASVVGFDAGALADIGAHNESLGLASALLMLRLNRAAAEGDLSWADYNRHVKRGLAKAVLNKRRDEEPRLGFPVPDWVREATQQMTDAVRASGVHVVGDLAELEPVPVPGVNPADVTLEDELEAAVWGLQGMVRRMAKVSAELQERPDEFTDDDPTTTREN